MEMTANSEFARNKMARHGFGRGEYKYFADPRPPTNRGLRRALYEPLVQLANRWNAAMDIDVAYTADHSESSRIIERIQLPIGLDQGLLNDVFAIQHRSGHA
jgi:hypothetical protein